MLKAAGQQVEASKPTLEINPEHVLVKRLAEEADEARAGDLAQVLYDQALLAEGGKLEDPAAFVKRINKLMLELSASRTQSPTAMPRSVGHFLRLAIMPR